MNLRPDYDNPDVRDGCLLRIASDLLVPFGELGHLDRVELIEWLSQVGIEPATGPQGLGSFWVEGACPDPEPRDEVTVLRRDGDWWIIGYWERGSFRVDHRFGSEGDACRWLLHDLVAHHATSMGTTELLPHARGDFKSKMVAVLGEVAELVRRSPELERGAS